MQAKLFLALLISGGILAGCTTPTPYQARVDNYGYANQRITDNRFRVSFSGNSDTSRDTVEQYLLYRAAEVTKESGNDWFRVVGSDVEAMTEFRITSTGTGFGRFTYFGGFGPYHPFGRPFGTGFETATARPDSRYNAIAMIKVGAGPTPDAPMAFDADQVLQNLGPEVVRPDDLRG